MAKKKKEIRETLKESKEVWVDIPVPKKHADTVKKLLKRINEEEKPPKPIKRVEKISKKELDQLWKLLKSAKPLWNKVEREYNRLGEYDNLNDEDQKWMDDYSQKISEVMLFVQEEFSADYF